MVVVCCIHIDSIGIICSFAEEDFRVEMFISVKIVLLSLIIPILLYICIRSCLFLECFIMVNFFLLQRQFRGFDYSRDWVPI